MTETARDDLIAEVKADLKRMEGKGKFADLPATTLPFRVISFLDGEVVDSRACVGENIDYEVRALAFGKTWDRMIVLPS